MTIKVLFFAGLRERLGRAEAQISADGVASVADVWAAAAPGEPLPDTLLCSRNQQHAAPDQAVADGDEVAFFPPVTGG